MESSLAHRDREGRHAGRLDPSVNTLVVGAEMLEVRAVARFSWIQDRNDQTGAPNVTPDATCGLDILRRRLRLAHNNHEAESRHVQSNLNHVCCETHIHWTPLIRARISIE